MGRECGNKRLQNRIHRNSTHKEDGIQDSSSNQQSSKRHSSRRSKGSSFKEGYLSNLPSLRGRVLVDLLSGSQEDGRLETYSEPQALKYIKPKRFRMESLAIVLKAPIRGRWATSIDLKDAYLHIPINQDHQRWLRFHIKDQAYAFRCLPFGLSTAPRVFTRVVKAVGAFLRRQGVQIHFYLDDWLITSQSLVMAHRHTDLVLRTLARLGFIVNLKKSHLQPTQSPIFLGARLDLLLGRVYPSQERICNLIECARIFNQAEYAPAAAWLKLLGLMASMVELVPWCRFRMRPIQLHLLYHYRPNLHPLSKPVPLSHIVHQELDWWEMESNLLVGRVFPVPPPQLVVTTDASKKGWGGHLKTFRVSGVWSQDQSLLHINVLELLAVFNSLKALELQTDISEKKILIKSDNSTVVSYINRQGGTRSPTLCLHTRHLLIWCIQRGIFLTAVHIPGIDNTLADNLSRGVSLNPTEWSLAPQIVQTIFERVGIFPTMDLFATRHNKQTQVFCSRTWDEKAFAIDALSISWNRMTSVRISPNFPDLQSNSKNSGRRLRNNPGSAILATATLVSNDDGATNQSAIFDTSRPGCSTNDGESQSTVPQCGTSKIDCLDIIKQHYQASGFSEKSANLVARGRRKSTLRVYSSRLRPYFDWCNERQIDPYHASIADIADFLETRHAMGLLATTVKGYKSAILAIHRGLPSGMRLRNDPDRSLYFLIEGMNNVRPPQRKIMPEWDLSTVLKSLNQCPYEPLQSASAKDLTVKTVFLIAIASGKRCSELHALATGNHIVFGNQGATLHFRPDFLAKNERSDFSMAPLFIPYLDQSGKDTRKKRLSCPVRALRWYLTRTETARKLSKSSQLFITSQKPFKPAAKSTIAGWMVTAIVKADAVKKGDNIPTAHSTRAISSSWAYNHGLSVNEIRNTVSWRTETTFVSRYLRDVGPCCDKAKFALSVLGASTHQH